MENEKEISRADLDAQRALFYELLGKYIETTGSAYCQVDPDEVLIERCKVALASQAPAVQQELGSWIVRKRFTAEGELSDCFVMAPREGDMAYGLEVLGDDYEGFGGLERKLEHCELIVSLVNAAPSPQGDAEDAARYRYLRDKAWKRNPGLFEGGRAAIMIGNHGTELDAAIDAARKSK